MINTMWLQNYPTQNHYIEHANKYNIHKRIKRILPTFVNLAWPLLLKKFPVFEGVFHGDGLLDRESGLAFSWVFQFGKMGVSLVLKINSFGTIYFAVYLYPNLYMPDPYKQRKQTIYAYKDIPKIIRIFNNLYTMDRLYKWKDRKIWEIS
jgi:hypothetical protein